VGEIVNRLRSTESSAVLGVIRIMLGVLFLMTGIMKLVVPMLWEAWSGQLMQGNIPFYTFNLWFVPIAETLIGGLFVRGLFSRVASVVAIPMMLVATYVHLVVKDPSLFPLQPKEPVIPIIKNSTPSIIRITPRTALLSVLRSLYTISPTFRFLRLGYLILLY